MDAIRTKDKKGTRMKTSLFYLPSIGPKEEIVKGMAGAWKR